MNELLNVDMLFHRMDSRNRGSVTEHIDNDLIVYARNTNKAYTFDWSEELESLFAHWSWCESKSGYLIHTACTEGVRKYIKAHYVLMSEPPFPGAEVDHVDRDRANNRMSNLRWVTHQANSCNRKLHRNNTSGFKGVELCKPSGKWKASARINYEAIHLGCFTNKIDAALCYDAFAEDHGLSTNKELGNYHWEDFCE